MQFVDQTQRVLYGWNNAKLKWIFVESGLNISNHPLVYKVYNFTGRSKWYFSYDTFISITLCIILVYQCDTFYHIHKSHIPKSFGFGVIFDFVNFFTAVRKWILFVHSIWPVQLSFKMYKDILCIHTYVFNFWRFVQIVCKFINFFLFHFSYSREFWSRLLSVIEVFLVISWYF